MKGKISFAELHAEWQLCHYASEASGGGSPLCAERRPSHRWQTESVDFRGAGAALEFVGFLTEYSLLKPS